MRVRSRCLAGDDDAERAPWARDRGFTLVELLVYVALFVVVLTIVGGFLISSLQAEKTVRGTASAANYGQLLAQSIQSGVRNATAIGISSPVDAAKNIPAGSQLLAVEFLDGAGAAPTKKCQGWLYTPQAGGQIFVRPPLTAPVTRPDLSSAFAGGKVVAPSGWQLYGEGVKPSASVPFAIAVNGSARGVGFDLSLAADRSTPVALRGQEFSRQNPVGSTSSCF